MRDSLKDVFSKIDWSVESKGIPRSGPGSTLEHSQQLRDALPALFEKYKVKKFIDAPCGDWHWMQEVNLVKIKYVGLEIVPELVKLNTEKFGSYRVNFKLADVTSDPLPKGDMIMCRDCLFHLKFWLRWAFLENFVASGTPYLLTTLHDNPHNRIVPENGKFRWFNPRLAPFNFPEPLELISDIPLDQEEAAADEDNFRARRYLGLWSRDQVIEAINARDELAAQ